MKTARLLLVLLSVSSPVLAQSSEPSRQIAVHCAKGHTITSALERGKDAQSLAIVIRGACEEVVNIRRSYVTIRGFNANSRLIGGFDIRHSSGVTIRDLTIQGGENHPHTGDFAAVNALHGSAVRLENVQVRSIRARGIQSLESSVSMHDVTIDDARGGAFTFRSSAIDMDGVIAGNNSPFGMTLVNSGAVAKGADLTFRGNVFGLIVQINSGLEHISGHLTVENNSIGVLVAGEGVLAIGSIAEVKNNTGPGILIDELSSWTPLVGAPGGGPALTVTGNAGPGISVERGSTFEVLKDTVVTGNQIGINVDNSVLRLADAAVNGNTLSDVKLAFEAKGEFGADNSLGSPVVCDATVVTRGSAACGASADVAAAPAAAGVGGGGHRGVVNIDALTGLDGN